MSDAAKAVDCAWGGVEEAFMKAKNDLKKGYSVRDLNTAKEWIEEAVERAEKMKAYFGQGTDAERLWQEMEQTRDSYMADYAEFKAHKELEDVTYDVDLVMGNAKRNMKQSSKAWWTDAIDELEKAEDLVKQLRVPEYESNPDVITYLSNFDSDAKALRETFADKMAEDELDDVIRDIKGIIQTATKYINEGNPSWWDDAINELEKGQEFRQQLVKFPNIPLAVKQLQEFDSAAADIKNQFHTKKAEREMEDLERDLNSKISTAKRHMTQGSPAWWSDALVELERAMDIRSDIVNSVYGELPFALRILREFDEAAAQIKLDYNTKTRIRECEDLSGDIRGKLNSAEGKMSKGDPAWWTEAMEELEEASAFGEKLKSLFSDLPQCQEAIGNLNFKSFEMKELFTTKRRDRDISDKTRDIKDALNEAERHMNHGDPAWWSDALQKVEEADEMVAKLNEKFGDSPSARSTILDSKIRSSAVRTLYNEKSLAREVSDQSRDVRMKLDEAESKMQKAPPVSWAEEAMEAVEEAASLAAKLSGPRYHDSEEARQTVANFEERRTVLKESYFDKVQGSIIRDIEQDLSLHMGNAERKIAGSSRQWWDEALDDLELATTVMMKLPRIPKTEETIAKHIARSADMRAEYNEKVRADDLSDLCRDLSSVMRTAADKMAKCPPVEWATEAMEEAEKAENIVKEILAPRFDALPKAKEALDNYNKELIALKDEFHSKVLEKEISDAKQDMQSAWGEAERKFNQNSRQWWDEAMEELEKVEAIISKTMSNSSLSRSKEIASVVSEYRNKGRTMRDEYTSKVVADEAKDRIRDVRHHLSAAEDKLKKGHAQFAEEAMADLEKATEELSHCRDSKFAGQSAIAELFEEYSKRSKEIRKEFTEQVTEGQARDKLQEVKSELSTAEMKFKQGPPSSWWDEAMEHLQNAEELNTKLKADAMLGQVDSVVEFQADLMQRAAGLRTGYSINMLKDNLKDALREVRDLLSAAEASFAKGPNRFWLDQAMEELSKAKDAMDTKLVKEVRFADEADYLEFKSDFETRSVSLSDKYREATLLADVEDVINKIQSKLSESKRCLEHQLYDESLQSLQEAEASSVTAASNTRIAGHPKLSEYLTTFYSDLKTLRDEFNEKTLNQTVSRLVYDLSSQLRTATDSFKKGPPTSWWDQGIEELDVLSEMIATNLSKCPPEVKSHNEVKEFLIKYEEEKEKMKKQYRENVSKAEYDKIVYQIKEKLSEAEFLMKRGPPVSYFDDAMEKLSDAQNINCKLCSDSRFRGEELNAFEQLFKEKVEDLQKAYNTNTLQESASDACRELRRFSSEAEHKMNQGPPRSYYDEALAIIQEGKDFANDLRACEVLANAADVSAALSSFDAQMTQLEKRYNELTVQDDVASHISSSKSHLQVAQSLFKKISPVTWLEEGLIEMFKAVDEAEVLKSDLYKDISDATSYLSELNTIVATLKEEYNNAVLADKLNAIKDECNRKLQQAADYMERGILDSALGCLEVGNRDLKGMKENRIFLGNTTAEEFIKEWSSKASDLKKQLAVKLHRDEARILLENGNRSLSDFSSAASESLKRAALLSAQRTVDSLLKKPLLIELEEVASFLKQKKDADASYATDFLQQEVAPITQAISVLIDSAESSSVRGAKKEARSLLEKATTLSFGNKKGPIPLNLTTDMMMSIPTVKNVMDRLVLKSRQWFKCNIVEEASEGGGASEEAGPVDPDQMTIQQFCTSEYKPPAEVPQLEQIPVSADIKACLLKYLRKFNESAETINNEARLAVKNANKIPWNTASNPKKWDYTAMSIDYSRYPIETIDRMCEYMTTSGPDRTISLMQQVAPEDPTVVGLVENFNEFRTQLQNYRTFWKRMEKFCRTYNTLSRLTKEGETADLQTTLKCESKSRAIIDELSSTHSTGSFPLKDRYLERLEKNHIEAHKRHSILYVTTFCKKHGEGGASSCLKQLQNFPRAYAEATRRYDEMTETHTQRQYPKERSEIEKRCRYNSFTPTAPAREDEDPDLWKAPYTVIKSGPEALSGFPSRPSAQLQASTQKIVDHNKSRHNKVVFARQNIDAACCKDSIFASEFQFGEQIHARAFWDTPICNYPVALDSENKPLYTLEKSKNHYAEFVLIAYINGEKVDRPLQPEGDIGNFTSRDEANFWGSQATVKIWAQKPDYILSNDDWAQSTQRINRKLITTYGPGKHTVKLEVCYRIIQKDKNYTMQTPNIPQFNTPLSHPIASGEYTVEVPSNPQSYSVFKPHTAKISPSAADELADLIKTGLSNHRMWGKAGKAEIPIHVCVKSDWRVVDTASVVVKNGGKITIYEEPSQYGVDCEVLFYRTPSRGWSNEEIVVFDLTAAAAEHRGETRGDPPTKTFPPKDFFVGSCFTAEPTLIPLDILKDLPRPSSNFDY